MKKMFFIQEKEGRQVLGNSRDYYNFHYSSPQTYCKLGCVPESHNLKAIWLIRWGEGTEAWAEAINIERKMESNSFIIGSRSSSVQQWVGEEPPPLPLPPPPPSTPVVPLQLKSTLLWLFKLHTAFNSSTSSLAFLFLTAIFCPLLTRVCNHLWTTSTQMFQDFFTDAKRPLQFERLLVSTLVSFPLIPLIAALQHTWRRESSPHEAAQCFCVSEHAPPPAPLSGPCSLPRTREPENTG